MHPIHTYRGWRSTKLHLALIAMGVICGAFVLIGAPPAAFGEFIMGVLGAAGIYSTSATADRFASRGSTPAAPPPPSEGQPS